MIIKKVNFSQAQLNTELHVVQDVPVVFSLYDSTNLNNIYYRPKSMYINNGSGGEVDICPMTDIEYASYLSGGSSISTLFPIADSTSKTFDNLKREVTKIVASGESGASAGIDVIFEYE